jgi:hypothetical protein
VSETHFTEQNYVNIPNYITYATNHPDARAHAGSAIIIRNDLKHHQLAKYETDQIQATNISIEDWDGNLIISAIYCPPRHKIKMEQYNAFIRALRLRFLVSDDFNTKHQSSGSRIINSKCRELYQTIQEKQLEILFTGEPTCLANRHQQNSKSTRFVIFKGL